MCIRDRYQHVYFRQALKDHKIIQSRSRKGNCYDNCIMETFFGRMKNEMFYGHEKEYSSFETFAKAVDLSLIHIYSGHAKER